MEAALHTYLYVAPVGVAALLLLAVIYRLMPQLTEESERIGIAERLLLLAVTGVGVALLYGRQLAGQVDFAYRGSGADTIDQYLPFYINLVRNIREGTFSLWYANYGLGASAFSCPSWTFDPFNFELVSLCLLLGIERIGQVVCIVHVTKIVLSALLFDSLLQYYCTRPLSRLLGAVLFAFSGYILMWGQHYWLGTAFVYNVLVILCLESYLQRRTARWFVALMLTVGGFCGWSGYVSFSGMLAAVCYALLRIPNTLDRFSLRTSAREFLRLALPVFCGVLLSCITLAPVANFLLSETNRVNSYTLSFGERIKLYSTSFVPLRWVPAILGRFMGTALINNASQAGVAPLDFGISYDTSYEFINLGFSCGVFLLLGQYVSWLVREGTWRGRVTALFATLLIGAYCFHCLLPSLSNGFVNPRYRSSFVVAIPLCIAMAVGFERRIVAKQLSWVCLIPSLLLSGAIMGWSVVNTLNGRILCFVFCLLLVLLTVALAQCGKREGALSHQLSLLLCVALLFGSQLADGFWLTNLRSEVDVILSGERTTDTQAAISWVRGQDSSWYRIEKIYGTGFSKLNNALVLGYEGVGSYNSTLDGDVADLYDQLYPEMLYGKTNFVQSWWNVRHDVESARFFGVRYLLSDKKLRDPQLELVHTSGQVLVYRYKDVTSPLLSAAGKVVYEKKAASLADAAARRALLPAAVIVADDVQEVSLRSGEVVTCTSDVREERQDHLSGSFEVSGDAVMCAHIPRADGWQVMVDGERVETFRANYGFIGFVVKGGKHTIDLVYRPKMVLVGAAISVVGLLLGLWSAWRVGRGHAGQGQETSQHFCGATA